MIASLNKIPNEAELRAKVVDVWLRDHGFTSDQIRLEPTFTLCLGHATLVIGSKRKTPSRTARGRADYLVRSIDGRNLFIIEAKSPATPIDDSSLMQAVSYARLLGDGGIAPFAIVTNGLQTTIVDTITRSPLPGEAIPHSHPYAIAGFRISGDDFSCRAEAIEHLITLSQENLMAFCKAQVDFRMGSLRSDSVDSGLKYIPSLYVPRKRQEESLDRLISDSRHCILVTGPPQVGKTNFICNYVEKQLASGTPCLFYPAAAQTSGLLESIRSDFEWTFNDSSSALQVVRGKLSRILRRSTKRMLIFLEGMNENRDFVRAFNADNERLQSEEISTIISLTSFSARDILLDQAGNPTFAARSIGIRKDDIPILEVSPSDLSSTLAVVALGPYTSDEVSLAYATYKNAFSVEVPKDHQLTHDPLLLRNAMEVFRGGSLPPILNAETILAKMVDEKLDRVPGLSYRAGESVIEEVASRLCEGRPVTALWLHQVLPNAGGLLDAALLTKCGVRSIDFYVTSERCFVIAHRLRHWEQQMRGSFEMLTNELSFVSKHEVRREAFRWFMIQPNNLDILTRAAQHLERITELISRQTIALCLCDYLATRRLDASDLDDDGAEKKDLHKQFRDTVFRLVSEAERGDSEISDSLLRMITDDAEQFEIRKTCAIGLGVFDPTACLTALAAVVGGCDPNSQGIFFETFEPGFRRATDELLNSYYNYDDYMCPSVLDHLMPYKDECLERYHDLHGICAPVIRLFGYTNEATKLEELLLTLNPDHESIQRRPDFRIQPSFDFKKLYKPSD